MPRKLLIIDDQIGVVRVIALVARQIGFTVKCVTDPNVATDTFIEFQPDTVILDMIMPEKDGVDVLHELLLTGTSARIVLTSGLSDAYLRLAEGVARFHGHDQTVVLRKPFRRHELIQALLAEEPSFPGRSLPGRTHAGLEKPAPL